MNLTDIEQKIRAVQLGYILPGVFLLAAVGLVFLVALPQFYQISQIRAEKDVLQDEIDELKQRIAVLSEYGAQKNLIRDYEELLLRALPEEKLVPQYMTQIEQMAQEAGLAAESVSFGAGTTVSKAPSQNAEASVTPPGAQELVVNATFTGPLSNSLKFLKTVESASRLVFARSIRTTYKEGSQEVAGSYTHTYGLVTYFMLREKATETASFAKDLQSATIQDVIKQLRLLNQYSTLTPADSSEESPSILEQPEPATPSAVEQDTSATP